MDRENNTKRLRQLLLELYSSGSVGLQEGLPEAERKRLLDTVLDAGKGKPFEDLGLPFPQVATAPVAAPVGGVQLREYEAPSISCIGKEAFASAALAHKVAKRRNRGGRAVGVYLCPVCNTFHMGERLKR